MQKKALLKVRVWSSECIAEDEGQKAEEWLSCYLKTSAKLVRMTPDFFREASSKYWSDDFAGSRQVSFADGFPFLLIAEESLVELNERLKGKIESPFKMNRFRPNIVTAGSPSFDEDLWRTMEIRSAIFHGIKRCSRCKITTVNQEEGVPHNEEPLATLGLFRKQEGSGVFFGQNLVHETNSGEVCVGDVVTVLERWEDGTCPPLTKK